MQFDHHASVEASTPDPDESNNEITVTSTVLARRSDLSIQKHGPQEVASGEPFSYTIDVANAGPGPADHVTVTDVLPAGVSFVDSTPNGTCSAALRHRDVRPRHARVRRGRLGRAPRRGRRPTRRSGGRREHGDGRLGSARPRPGQRRLGGRLHDGRAGGGRRDRRPRAHLGPQRAEPGDGRLRPGVDGDRDQPGSRRRERRHAHGHARSRRDVRRGWLATPHAPRPAAW